MKLNKSAYLFAAALVASTMGMTSCSSEDEIGVETVAGQETTVTMALSVAPSTRSTADEVNLGTTKNAIANVAVVPMVGNAPQKPVRWATVANTGKSDAQTVQLLSSVDGFKVYGNLTETQYKATENVYSLTDDMFALQQSTKNAAYKAPHSQLYYYRNIGTNEFYTSSTGDTWAGVTDWALAASVGTAKYVKVDGINYAVGVLAAAVMNGDNTECFTKNGAPCDAATAGVTVSGIIVDGQKSFTKDLQPKEGTGVQVYEDAAKTTFGTRIGSTMEANNGNIFMIASPSGTEEVNVNIEFTLPEGVSLKQTSGKTITGAQGGTKFYLALKLKPTTDHKVFEADYVTILNATVTNWGIATEIPQQVSDAQIGVEFNMDWNQGNLYDVEI